MPKVTEDKEKGEKVIEDEVINNSTALWVRSKTEITDEEYNEFYKHIAHDFEPPLARIHCAISHAQSDSGCSPATARCAALPLSTTVAPQRRHPRPAASDVPR